MPVQLRIGVADDAKLLAQLGAVCFSEAFARHNDPEDFKNYLAEAFDEEKIKQELLDSELTFIIAFDESNEPAGYAKLNRKETPKELNKQEAIQLQRIYVRQQIKGKKVGALLMQKCIDILLAEKRKVLWLGVWQENYDAIAFYKKWGFEIFGVKQFIIGNKVDDDYVMKKVF